MVSEHKLARPAPSAAISIREENTNNNDIVEVKWNSKTAEFEGARRLLLLSFTKALSSKVKRELAGSLLKSDANDYAEEVTLDHLEDIIYKAAIDKQHWNVLVPFFEASGKASLGDMETAIQIMCNADSEIFKFIRKSVDLDAEGTTKKQNIETETPNVHKKVEATRKKLVGTALELFAGFALKYCIASMHDGLAEKGGEHVSTTSPGYNKYKMEGCYISEAPERLSLSHE